MPEDRVELIIKAVDNVSNELKKIESNIKSFEEKVKSSFVSVQNAWLKIAAAAVTFQQTFASIESYAAFEEAMQRLNSLTSAYGINARQMIERIKEASEGLISMSDAASTALLALSRGLSPEQIENLARASTYLSDVVGKTAVEAFAELTEGITRNRERALEAYVGAFNLKEIYGELADKMSETEKSQALYNIVMQKALQLQQQFGASAMSTADKIEKLKATIADLRLQLGEIFTRVVMAAIGALNVLGSSIVRIVQSISWVFYQITILGAKVGEFFGLRPKGESEALKKELEVMMKAMSDTIDAMSFKGFEQLETAFSSWEQKVKAGAKKIQSLSKIDTAKAAEEWAREKARLEAEIEELLSVDRFEKAITEAENQASRLLSKYGQLAEARALISEWLGLKILKVEEERAEAQIKIENEITQQYLSDYEKKIWELDDWKDAQIRAAEEAYKTEEELLTAKAEIEEAYKYKRAQLIVELEQEITEKTKTEYEKRLLEVDKWYKEAEEKIKAYAKTHEEYETLMIKITEAAEAQKAKIRAEREIELQKFRLATEKYELEKSYRLEKITEYEYLKQSLELSQQELALIEQKIEQFSGIAGMEEYVFELQRERLGILREEVDLRARLMEYEGTFLEGYMSYFAKYNEELTKHFSAGRDFAQHVAGSMEQAFMNFLDVTSEGFMNWHNLIRSILISIYQELLKILIIKPLIGWFGGLFGGLFHEGGFVTAGAPVRFHVGGLYADEVPAILQTGEYVVSRRGVNALGLAMLDAINRGNIAAAQPAKQELTIVNVVDPKMVGDYLATPAGQKAILNVLASQNYKIKKIIGE